jgi:hypothetical protein
MEITRGRLKQIIREEVERMTVADDSTLGNEIAEKLISEFKDLSLNDRQVFLSKFVQFLNKENA